MSEPKEKAGVKERPEKPPKYRKCEKLKKKVISSPPLSRASDTKQSSDC